MTGKMEPDQRLSKGTGQTPGATQSEAGADEDLSGERGVPHSDSAQSKDAEAQLRKENIELKDRLLRALAEVQNNRRRTERDLNDMRQYAITHFAADMLSVADNLERAISSIPTHRWEDDEAIKTLIEGIELTENDLRRSLEKHGIKKLEPLGERFDPNFHEAIFEIPDANVPKGGVSRIVQPGYSIGSRVLRPAKVGISSGHPQGKG